MDKDSRDFKGQGTMVRVIKQEPNAWVSSLKEFIERILKPSNYIIATGPKLDRNTLHIKASSLE